MLSPPSFVFIFIIYLLFIESFFLFLLFRCQEFCRDNDIRDPQTSILYPSNGIQVNTLTDLFNNNIYGKL